MSLLAITDAGVAYKDAVFAGEEVQNITRIIFRNIDGLVPETAIDLTQSLPSTDIVHSEQIERVSALNDNAVVMSTVLGYDVGDFEYNWYGVIAKKADLTEVLIAVVQTPAQTKTKTVGITTGNYSVKSIVWKTANIAQSLNVTLNALPWQVSDNTFVEKTEFDSKIIALNDLYLSKNEYNNLKSGRKNAIVDGRFDFWYEGVIQSSSGYGSDTMWINAHQGSNKVHSQIVIPLMGIPEVPTARLASRTEVSSVVGSGNFVNKTQRIEDVKNLAGKEVTISFYASTDAGQSIAVNVDQSFGVSAPVRIAAGKVAVSSGNFKRYSLTFMVPSIVGKTLSELSTLDVTFWYDAGSNFDERTSNLGHQSGTFEITCVQLEEGSVATKFEDEGKQQSLTRVNRHAKILEFGMFTTIPVYESKTGISSAWLGFSSEMRSTPTASTLTNASSKTVRLKDGSVGGSYTSIMTTPTSKTAAKLAVNAGDSMVTGIELTGAVLFLDARL